MCLYCTSRLPGGEGRAGEGRAGQGRAGQGRAGGGRGLTTHSILSRVYCAGSRKALSRIGISWVTTTTGIVDPVTPAYFHYKV